ncbi:MAG: chemotaxis-specific protein-glutamate methyltransferase CheB [Oscillospiraceae bacterium]|jgi:two-component system chemotaxis response regulator CheB|nr:chemotaxis-specific protein-glutamate methyltransferase CheB [Oscillospiraceae bacterium]
MPAGKIRVLVVDDSLFFRGMLVRGLSSYTDIEVVGEAYDPYDARDSLQSLDPDVMTLDIEMPNMNGVEFLKILLPQWKIPVVVISSRGDLADAVKRAGAADFFQKPDPKNPEAVKSFLAELPKRVRYAVSKTLPAHQPARGGSGGTNAIIALGASTGGTQATARIIKELPADLPGIVIVQHMPPDFTRMYAQSLDRDCALTVSEAREGDVVERGKALIAPGGETHMEVQKRGDKVYIHLARGEKVNGHCPSVDTLFHSVARQMPGRSVVGVLLTGMGADGARGLLALRKAGAYTLGQDEKSSVVYGMPREAYEIGAVTKQAPLEQIAGLIVKYAQGLR